MRNFASTAGSLGCIATIQPVFWQVMPKAPAMSAVSGNEWTMVPLTTVSPVPSSACWTPAMRADFMKSVTASIIELSGMWSPWRS